MPPERAFNLWMVAAAPTVWAVHFLLCYITAAIWCARVAGEQGALGAVRTAIAWYTAGALAAILAIGIRGLRDHTGYGVPTSEHDFDTPEDRHRFLGFASLLLAGLSAVATVLVALGAVFFETCR